MFQSVKKSAFAAAAFFLTLVSLSVSYAALSA